MQPLLPLKGVNKTSNTASNNTLQLNFLYIVLAAYTRAC